MRIATLYRIDNASTAERKVSDARHRLPNYIAAISLPGAAMKNIHRLIGLIAISALIGSCSKSDTGTGPDSAPVASVTVSVALSNLVVGQTTQATAVLKDADGNVLTNRT